MSDAWQRLQELVEAAAELAPDLREAYVTEQTPGDPALRDEALGLLRAGLEEDAFLEPLVGDAPLQPGAHVGPFRIVRPLARGGMGAVFVAEQEAPARRVALKVMRDDLFTPASRARFAYEIEALGALAHPGIAAIYQAGMHGTLPWFAMELVEGGSTITQHAGQAGLDADARIALVADITDAVHHGHVKGVLHRDLKPDNLLIDPAGRPRVIDFGVARVTDSERRLTTIRTQSQSIVGTLAYMSPEQARGGAGDARSDVYSLGVVLFELLTEALPIELDPGDFLTSARRIAEDAPRSPAALRPELKGDAEAILLKALTKEPERRYASAAAFGDDLRRFLAHEPVEARIPGAWDRLRAFARRNRLAVGAGAAILGVSLAAAAISLAFAVRSHDAESVALAKTSEAQGERDRANDLLTAALQSSLQTVFDAVPEIHSMPGGAKAAERVLQNTVAQLEDLLEQSAGAPRVHLALAEAKNRLGDALGNPRFANRGDAAAAKKAYDAANAHLDRAVEAPALRRDAGLLRAILLRKGVELRRRNPKAEGTVEDLERAVAILEGLLERPAAKGGESWKIQAVLALTTKSLSQELQRRKRPEQATITAREAVRRWESVRARRPQDPQFVEMLAAALSHLGHLELASGRRDAARESFDRSVDLLAHLANDPAEAARSGLTLYWLGRAHLAIEEQDFDVAEALITNAKNVAIARCEADPTNHRRRFDVAAALSDWIRVVEKRDGAQVDGTAPATARARAREAAATLTRLAPSPDSMLVTTFARRMLDYAEGTLAAGTLMGTYGD